LKTTIQTNLSALLGKFKGKRYAWIRKRIRGTWPHWLTAIEELGQWANLYGTRRKKVTKKYACTTATITKIGSI